MPKVKKQPVIVTTEFRGVFFGYLNGAKSQESVELTNARNVIFWSGNRGFLGLAKHGPESESRVGSIVDKLTLYKVTSISDCTPEAEKKFLHWPQP